MAAGALAALAACAPGPVDRAASSPDAVEIVDAGAPARDARVAPRRCAPPRGVSGAPDSIAEAVALINALPQPVTIPCFLESLDRPLHLQAAHSIFSAQPARGIRSPRFLIYPGGPAGKLVATVAPEGDGRALLEFGEFVDATRTLKGELKFPIEAAVDPAAPYEQIRSGEGTTCRGCHRAEERHAAVGFAQAYVSAALRPEPRAHVDLDGLQRERASCDAQKEPERCAFLEALFGQGEVRLRELPSSLPTIFY
jgi:hypothetical protein